MDKSNKEHLLGSVSSIHSDGTLGRDLYSNKFTFQVSKHWLFTSIAVSALSTFIISMILHINTNSGDLPAILSVVFGIALIIILFAAIFVFAPDDSHMSLTTRMYFLSQIIEVRPAVSMDEWDIVASNMNKFMYEHGISSSPYHYFDGKSCYSSFRQLFLEPYLRTEESQASMTYEELRPYIKKAVEVYNEGITLYWERETGQSSPSQE